MTVNNIAGMGKIAGLDIMALTDHNSTENLPAFFTACENYGVIPIGGMELTTAEDIHMVCLFPTLSYAMEFGEAVKKRRIRIENRPEIFGEQQILDSEDNVKGVEKYLLLNATTLTLDEGFNLCKSFGGIVYPAHIDRESNGIIAVLGAFPDEPEFSCAEIYSLEKEASLKENFPVLNDKRIIYCSDAHYLDKIPDAENYFEFSEGLSDDEVRKSIIDYLKG